MTKLLPWLLVALIVCCAAFLRLVQVDESLWLDELHTAWTVADGPGEIGPRAAIGNHSPVYFSFVWALTKTAGLSELTLRLPSAIAGVALVALAYLVVLRWTGSWSAGLLAALLVCLDRDCVFYGQEARPYACVQLVGLAHIALFSSLLAAPTRFKRIGFIALGILLFYLHYTAALLFLAEVVSYAVLFARRSWRPKYLVWQFLIDLTVIAACLLPALPHLLEIAGRRSNWAMFVQQLPLSAIILVIFPLRNYLPLLPLLVLGAAILAFRWRCGTSRESAESPHVDVRHFILIVCWLFVPLGIAWVATERDMARIFFLRYVIVAALAPIMFSALCYAACSEKITWNARALALAVFRNLCALALVASVIHSGGMREQYRRDGRVIGDRNQDWRSAVRLLNARASNPETPVFVRSGLIEADALYDSSDRRLRDYCLLPVLGIYRIQRDAETVTPLPTSAPANLKDTDRKRIATVGEAWFLLSGTPAQVKEMEIQLCRRWEAFRARASVAEHHAFGNVAVLCLIVRARDAAP